MFLWKPEREFRSRSGLQWHACRKSPIEYLSFLHTYPNKLLPESVRWILFLFWSRLRQGELKELAWGPSACGGGAGFGHASVITLSALGGPTHISGARHGGWGLGLRVSVWEKRGVGSRVVFLCEKGGEREVHACVCSRLSIKRKRWKFTQRDSRGRGARTRYASETCKQCPM